MGFLGGLFKKKQGSDPLDAMRARVEENPNDARLAQDLANQLKAAGDLAGAQEYARRAAQAHQTAGFATRALAVLKGAVAWGQPSPELLQDLANIFLELKHKEDARGTLLQLRRMHAASGNTSALPAIDAQLQELGPGR
jgi:hypothetical protein